MEGSPLRGSFSWARSDSGPLHPRGLYLGWIKPSTALVSRRCRVVSAWGESNPDGGCHHRPVLPLGLPRCGKCMYNSMHPNNSFKKSGDGYIHCEPYDFKNQDTVMLAKTVLLELGQVLSLFPLAMTQNPDLDFPSLTPETRGRDVPFLLFVVSSAVCGCLFSIPSTQAFTQISTLKPPSRMATKNGGGGGSHVSASDISLTYGFLSPVIYRFVFGCVDWPSMSSCFDLPTTRSCKNLYRLGAIVCSMQFLYGFQACVSLFFVAGGREVHCHLQAWNMDVAGYSFPLVPQLNQSSFLIFPPIWSELDEHVSLVLQGSSSHQMLSAYGAVCVVLRVTLDVIFEEAYDIVLEAGRELSTTGSKHDGIEARWENLKLGENPNFGIMEFFEEAGGSGNIFTGYQNSSGHQNGSEKIFGIDHGSEICRKGKKSRKPTEKPEVARCMSSERGKHEVDRPSMRCLRACNRSMLIDMCVLVWLLACTPGMNPDMWEEWWRPACVLDMQPDMWSTRCRRACVRSHAKRHTGCHQPEADWLVSPINTPTTPAHFFTSRPVQTKLKT
ncbi:hypothetical protein YC2023_099954 [Brassica napus]